MDLNIDSLVIEVTRKCNMRCDHCLRGSAQRRTIKNNYIYKMLNLIDSVSTLNITGGEPTLAMESLEYLRQRIIYGNCSVYNFYMVTNGKAINVEKVAEWTYQMYNACSDNEISGVAFSFDQFHTNTFNWAQLEKQKRNYHNLKEVVEYDYGLPSSGNSAEIVKKHTDGSWRYLIKEGRAKDFGVRECRTEVFDEYEDNNNICFPDAVLYLSCSGYIIAGCDWSYHSMDNRKDIQIAHIDDINCQDDLIEAIRRYNKTREEKEELQMV